MNDRQLAAVSNHCRFAFEIMHPRFFSLVDKGKYSAVLTVNSGYE